jgi:tRNA pseudouridine38-40 synthase
MRYFLEVSYKGTGYSGFQAQKNANTVQAEIEKALLILLKKNISMTGSSRTDTGVHALQNFFHFDTDLSLHSERETATRLPFLYNLNAILPGDIVAEKLIPVAADAHCRFDAISREYKYYIYGHKNPFLRDRAFYFPYKMNIDNLQQAASVLKEYDDFTSFSKRNTQVKTFVCKIMESEWMREDDCLVFRVKANRFLRGMVRAMVATMLQVGRNKISIADFKAIIESKDCTKASFSVPGYGLFLVQVVFPYVGYSH